ncbi:hypothetical protein Peur_071883 [Populus x canadensis]
MDGYIPHPPAQDSATAGYSSAAKGGLAGVLVVLLLAIVFYVFFQRRNCLEEGDPGKVQVINIVEMGERSVDAGEQELQESYCIKSAFGSWQLDRFVVDGYAVVWWFYCALSVGSVPTPSPLRVYEGSFSRRHPTRDPVFLPSVAFPFVFARLSPLVELLAAWTWTVALASVIA